MFSLPWRRSIWNSSLFPTSQPNYLLSAHVSLCPTQTSLTDNQKPRTAFEPNKTPHANHMQISTFAVVSRPNAKNNRSIMLPACIRERWSLSSKMRMLRDPRVCLSSGWNAFFFVCFFLFGLSCEVTLLARAFRPFVILWSVLVDKTPWLTVLRL